MSRLTEMSAKKSLYVKAMLLCAFLFLLPVTVLPAVVVLVLILVRFNDWKIYLLSAPIFVIFFGLDRLLAMAGLWYFVAIAAIFCALFINYKKFCKKYPEAIDQDFCEAMYT